MISLFLLSIEFGRLGVIKQEQHKNIYKTQKNSKSLFHKKQIKHLQI